MPPVRGHGIGSNGLGRLMTLESPDLKGCMLCNGTARVAIAFSSTGRLYPCPECQVQTYTVSLDVSRHELEESEMGAEELLDELKRNLRDRLLGELIDKVGEVTTEYLRGEGRYVFVARLVVVAPQQATERIRPVDLPEPLDGLELELITLCGGEAMFGHRRQDCLRDYCCMHNPSEHHMRDWPQHWRSDSGKMERLCPHGTGHPDPDDSNDNGMHGCDGCCRPPTG